MKQEAIIIGAGTYGQVYAEYLKAVYDVVGFYDDNTEILNKKVSGIQVKGTIKEAYSLNTSTAVFVPLGSNSTRVRLLKSFERKGFEIPSFIHPDTNVHSSVKIGKAVYVLPGTHIMPLSEIKDYVMISMGVNIAHHTRVSEGCFFSQGSNIGASIHFGEKVFCGIASTVMTGVKRVGQNALIGAGAVIIRDVPDGATVVGNPGRIIKMK